MGVALFSHGFLSRYIEGDADVKERGDYHRPTRRMARSYITDSNGLSADIVPPFRPARPLLGLLSIDLSAVSAFRPGPLPPNHTRNDDQSTKTHQLFVTIFSLRLFGERIKNQTKYSTR